jgi:hypothetical protein
MEIRNSGDFGFCRWSDTVTNTNIRSETPLHFFQNNMSSVRNDMLHGLANPDCEQCYNMEQHHKVSGRQRQLLKTGITVDNFEKSMRSSTYWPAFAESNAASGKTGLAPVDWQINLGNYCNSGCVFCSPDYSSRLAQEFKKIKITQTEPAPNWTADPGLIDQFVSSLANIDQLAYLHFLGGETLITPAFKIILEKIIAAKMNHKVSIGFTTNLTVWDRDIIELLTQFDQVHVGMSVECFHTVNDYVRWPSDIKGVEDTAIHWITVGQQHNWYMSLRTTPTVLTISHLTTVYDFARRHGIGIESCNFLHNPKFLRMNVLPMQYRREIADQIQTWVNQQNIDTNTQLINIRHPDQLHLQITQDAMSYVDYLLTAPDETDRLPELVQYLKLLESSRANSILDYVPEYEQLFRSAGY